ncbi:MAG: sulfatase-like hydrolase/transferase, partial [Pirellulales bacterium]
MFLSASSGSKGKQLFRYTIIGSFVVLGIFQQTVAEEITTAGDGNDRRRLPVADVRHPPVEEADPSQVRMPEDNHVSAPEGAPNVVLILLDDLGFGGPASFGGAIAMPTLGQLASNGLRFNRFHTVALCAPTRAALRHGRNHHVLNMGSIPEIATGFPGNTCRLPNDTASLAEILRLNGYNTAAFGKWHSTLGRETTVSGPQDTWPTRQGFEKFYGFIGAEENMYEPTLHD